MKVIYIDELFLLNLIFDYFLLLAAAKICSAATTRVRLVLAAVFGALYAALTALPELAILSHPAAKVASGAVMLLIAFGFARRFARIALVFFAVTAAGAGVVTAVSLLGGSAVAKIDLRVLCVTFIICYVAVTLIFKRAARPGQRYAKLELKLGARSIELRALADTGNALRDPATLRPAAVVSARDVCALFTPDKRRDAEAALRRNAPDAALTLARILPEVKFRLIPYTAVGAGGTLVAFSPDEAYVNGTRREIAVAVSPNDVSDNATYNAIIAEELANTDS